MSRWIVWSARVDWCNGVRCYGQDAPSDHREPHDIVQWSCYTGAQMTEIQHSKMAHVQRVQACGPTTNNHSTQPWVTDLRPVQEARRTFKQPKYLEKEFWVHIMRLKRGLYIVSHVYKYHIRILGSYQMEAGYMLLSYAVFSSSQYMPPSTI